jgi:hypothetical protein
MDFIKNVLVVVSAACFIVGSTFLAKSIRWSWEDLRDDKGYLLNAAKRMGSPGRTDTARLKSGIILNAVGYGILVVSTIV